MHSQEPSRESRPLVGDELDRALGDLVLAWERRGSRSSAAGWVHHLGEVVFVMQDRWHDDNDVRRALLGLAARDVALIVTAARGIGPEWLRAAVALSTDFLFGWRLSKRLPKSDFVQDHALSQLGLSSAWAQGMLHPQTRMAALAFYPLTMQTAFALMWKVEPREIPWYLCKEGFWSVATLWAVDDLRQQVGEAVRTTRESTRRQTEAIEEAQRSLARAKMSQVVWRWIHRDGISALGTVAFEAEALGDASRISPEDRARFQQIARQARREANRLRATAPIDEDSFAARIGRALAVRDMHERRYDWRSGPMPPIGSIPPARGDAVGTLEAVIAGVEGTLELGVDEQPAGYMFWAAGDFSGYSVTAPFVIDDSRRRLTGLLTW